MYLFIGLHTQKKENNHQIAYIAYLSAEKTENCDQQADIFTAQKQNSELKKKKVQSKHKLKSNKEGKGLKQTLCCITDASIQVNRELINYFSFKDRKARRASHQK